MFGRINDSERTEAMRSAALNLDMQFTEQDEYGIRSLMKDFKLFQKGGSKKVYNLMQKKSGFLEEKFSILDYKYSIRSNNSSRTYRQTVFFIQSKYLALPEMLLVPEHFFHKIGAWLGMQDIDFEEHPGFSEKYLLKGEDEPRIRRTITDQVVRFFTVEKDWCLESCGYFMILYRKNELCSPAYIESLFRKGLILYENLKTADEQPS